VGGIAGGALLPGGSSRGVNKGGGRCGDRGGVVTALEFAVIEPFVGTARPRWRVDVRAVGFVLLARLQVVMWKWSELQQGQRVRGGAAGFLLLRGTSAA